MGLLTALDVSSRFAVAWAVLALATGGLLAYFAGGVLANHVRVGIRHIALALTLPVAFLVIFPSVIAVGYLNFRTLFPAMPPVVAIAFLAGTNARWRSPALAFPLFALFVVLATWNAVGVAGSLRGYAREWDTMEATLKAARGDSGVVHVAPLASHVPNIWPIRRDPAWVVNQCVASLYGVGGVSAPEAIR